MKWNEWMIEYCTKSLTSIVIIIIIIIVINSFIEWKKMKWNENCKKKYIHLKWKDFFFWFIWATRAPVCAWIMIMMMMTHTQWKYSFISFRIEKIQEYICIIYIEKFWWRLTLSFFIIIITLYIFFSHWLYILNCEWK